MNEGREPPDRGTVEGDTDTFRLHSCPVEKIIALEEKISDRTRQTKNMFEQFKTERQEGALLAEDIRTGFLVFSAVIYCPESAKQSYQLYQFLNNLLFSNPLLGVKNNT